MNDSLTALPGVRVGHWTNLDARTGCTVILMPDGGAIASGETRGSAPGTRETALLEPEKGVERINAIMLSGGSAYGLAAATGAMQWLEARGQGVRTPGGVVPIVPSAVIFDLAVGDASQRPDAAAGLAACETASSQAIESGRIGAGTGAMVGKALGFGAAEPGGIGNALMRVGDVMLAVLVVANPSGDIVNEDGQVISGARDSRGQRLDDAARLEAYLAGRARFLEHTNTTLVAVGTDAKLSKVECKVLAQAAQMGLARATRPSHSPHDGDVSFVFSVGAVPAPPMIALVTAVQTLVHRAMIDAVNRIHER
jgi:L-aminopeptidase/D-esterase-like protein